MIKKGLSSAVLLFLSFEVFAAVSPDTIKVPRARDLERMYHTLVLKVDSARKRAIEDSILIANYIEETRMAALAAMPPPRKPSNWTNTLVSQLNFSQISLTNWAAGGKSSLSLNAYVDFRANYKKNKTIFENRLQAGYGFIKTFGDIYKKSDDRIVIDSKWGYQAVKTLYVSAAFNAKTQMMPGFTYAVDKSTRVSEFGSPAYISLALGLDYKPKASVALNFSPLTGGLVIVSHPDLRKKYGNREDRPVRPEFGAQLKVNFNKEIFKNVKVTSVLNLFSNYLDRPQNVQVQWDFTANMTINKFMSANIRTNLIYDDKISITDKNGNTGPRLQFKEVFGIGFSYTLKSNRQGAIDKK